MPADQLRRLRAMQGHVSKLTDVVKKCTVGVQVGPAWGSGVIISKDGYVLTAAHVAGQPNRKCEFTLNDGRKVEGKTLGMFRRLDAGRRPVGSRPGASLPDGHLRCSVRDRAARRVDRPGRRPGPSRPRRLRFMAAGPVDPGHRQLALRGPRRTPPMSRWWYSRRSPRSGRCRPSSTATSC